MTSTKQIINYMNEILPQFQYIDFDYNETQKLKEF